jgi:hypothetical protein
MPFKTSLYIPLGKPDHAIKQAIIFSSILMIFNLTITSQNPFYAEGQLECNVEIVGGMANMSPGEFVSLRAIVDGDFTIKNYTWNIEGPVVKDYDDDVLGGAYEVEDPTPLSAEDFHGSSIAFYWGKSNTTNQNRTVNVNVGTDNGICTDVRNYMVAIDTEDSNRQAEDFFVANRYMGVESERAPPVLLQHNVWHFFYNFSNPSYNNNGDTFFKFHDIYIKHFDKWRSEFGYPIIEPWDPGNNIEIGVDMNHTERDRVYNRVALPEWFKFHQQNTILENRTSNGNPCEEADAPVPPWPPKQNSLDDFDSNLKLLGCAFTDPFHNDVHGAIGGHMSSTGTAPLDPIFWRWHKYANNVAEARSQFQVPVVLEGVFGIAPILADVTAPRVVHQDPFILPPFKDNLQRINVTFSEPVLGIAQNDLLVNGSPATIVNGSGTGPYVFTGFAEPSIGPVNVTLSSANITDISRNQFEGDFWEYILVDANDNIDGDGVSQELEVNLFGTDPTLDDSDGDRIIDGIEVSFPCLNALEDDSHVMNMTGSIINKTGRDTDNDGITNVNEVLNMTDPCSPQTKESIQTEFPANDSVLEGISPIITMSAPTNPLTIMIERTGNLAGENTRLMYNSATNEATSIVDGNKTTRPISAANETIIQQIVNNSDFFAADSFYPPKSDSTSYSEFMAFISMGDTFHAVYWTDASEGVPETIRNLPFVLDEIAGSADAF